MNDRLICACTHCGTKNRIPQNKIEQSVKCGRCKESFIPRECQKEVESLLTLRCSKCRVKNRVPEKKLHSVAKCGRCGSPLQHQDIMSGRTVMVTDANFDQMVMESPLPVLLYCWGPSCGVCSGTTPQVDQMAMETKGRIRVAKVNVEANPHISSKYNILSVPSFFIFDAGVLKEHLTGAHGKHDLMVKMARYI